MQPNGEQSQRVWSPKRVSVEIDAHIETVYLLLRSGKLKGTKVGRHWKIKPESVDALLNGEPVT